MKAKRTLEGMNAITDCMTNYALEHGLLDKMVRGMHSNPTYENPTLVIHYTDGTQKTILWSEVLEESYNQFIVVTD